MLKFFSPFRLSVVWTLLILIGLSIPGQNIPTVEVFQLDKLVHFGLFFILAGLWLTAKSDATIKKGLRVLVVVLLFAVATEFYQQLMPIGRTADMLDAAANSVGAMFGFGVWILLKDQLDRWNG